MQERLKARPPVNLGPPLFSILTTRVRKLVIVERTRVKRQRHRVFSPLGTGGLEPAQARCCRLASPRARSGGSHWADRALRPMVEQNTV